MAASSAQSDSTTPSLLLNGLVGVNIAASKGLVAILSRQAREQERGTAHGRSLEAAEELVRALAHDFPDVMPDWFPMAEAAVEPLESELPFERRKGKSKRPEQEDTPSSSKVCKGKGKSKDGGKS